MLLLDRIVETRVAEAAERGEFDDLPGAGRPQVYEDDALVPEALRAGYRILKNAGFVPPEVARRREIADVESLLAATTDPEERSRARRRLELLRTRIEAGGATTDLRGEEVYYRKLTARFERDSDAGAG